MPVKTKNVTLDREWHQIADGATGLYVQVKEGVLEFVISDELPPADFPGHDTKTGFKVTPPTQIWGRSRLTGESVEIAVSPTDET